MPMANSLLSLTPKDKKAFSYSSFILHEQGLLPIGTPTKEEWLECGRFLRHTEASVHFWIGDWARYGDAHFKEDYQKLEEITGYSYHTLRRDKYLTERIQFERRRSHLDIAIHHEVAPLDKNLQELILNKAQIQGLTVQQVRVIKHRLTYETNRSTEITVDPGLLLGDCVEVLSTLPDASVDCIVTDPPYGIDYQSEHRTIPFDRLANDADPNFTVLDKALAIASRKLKNNSHVYIFTIWRTYPQMVAIVAKYFIVKNVLVWEKNNWTPGDLEANYAHQHEMIIFAHKGRRHLFGRRDSNVLHFDRVPENALQHPTEKPVKLLEYLISKSTLEGEAVLDMFMGIGSTCLAAKNMKRRYIGIEIDQQWYDIATQRLDAVDSK